MECWRGCTTWRFGYGGFARYWQHLLRNLRSGVINYTINIVSFFLFLAKFSLQNQTMMIDIKNHCGGTRLGFLVSSFQEIVPLSASNVLGSENSKVSMKWNSLIRRALNNKKKPHCLDKIQHSNEEQHKNIPGYDFRCIISKQMVGILITVWVRSYLCPYIRYPSVSCIGCGIMGCLGNKVIILNMYAYCQTNNEL